LAPPPTTSRGRSVRAVRVLEGRTFLGKRSWLTNGPRGALTGSSPIMPKRAVGGAAAWSGGVGLRTFYIIKNDLKKRHWASTPLKRRKRER